MKDNQKKIDDYFKKPRDKKEPEKLEKYMENLQQKEDPNRKTLVDKIAEFFRNFAMKTGLYYQKKPKKESNEQPSSFSRKLKAYYRLVLHKIIDKFNFESGVDILDDTSVLYRRNRVNKNILLVTNMVFILFTLIGNQHPNYIVIAGFSVLMLAINTTLTRIIHEKPRTLLKQQMAMYIGSVYIIVASLAVYIKLRVSAVSLKFSDILGNPEVIDVENALLNRAFYAITDQSIAQAGYILIYFALVVIALYQDPTLLRILFKWVLVLMTIIHITIMYPLYEHAGSLEQLYTYLFVSNPNVFIDIVLRTILLIVFNIALYSSVSIGDMMNNKRKQELIKRRDLERDFKAVVGDVFDVIGVFNSHTINQSVEEVHRIAEFSSRLGRMLGLSKNLCTEIYEYSVIHIDKVKELSILEYEDKEVLNEEDYQIIREKTILGSVIIKRLQLNQKSEDIVRAHFEKTVDQTFIEKIKRVQRSQEGQVILLAEIYDILRQSRNYKTELKHKRAVELLQLEFKEYFEPYILDRFLKYQLDFERIYESYQYRK
ncbi:MAG: HD domain-containing phosphohydrolase [Candidatus Izemoplasmataceae bacterium]